MAKQAAQKPPDHVLTTQTLRQSLPLQNRDIIKFAEASCYVQPGYLLYQEPAV